MDPYIEELTVQDLTHLPSQDLQGRLRDLIRRYAHNRSADLAQAVLHHIEALYLHPEMCRDPEQLCLYTHFARHWRWLTAQYNHQPNLQLVAA